jgi:hypothetical protein
MVDSSCFHIAEDPQLFVDDFLIEAAQGVTRRWHRPEQIGDAPDLPSP